MPMVSREALYELVWSDAVRTVAERFGVSDVGLRKICAKADVPVPARGFWAKQTAGKAPPRTRLPPREPGMPDAAVVGEAPRRHRWPPDPEAELAEPPPTQPSFPEPIASVEARVATRVGKVGLERGFASPHPLIRRLLDDDEIRRSQPDNVSMRLWRRPPLFESGFERRRLRVLNSLFIGAAKAGARAWVSDEVARKVGVRVGVAHVHFGLDHPDAKPNRDGNWQVREGHADLLRLTIEGPGAMTWEDTEAEGLESHLTPIVVRLIVSGELQYRTEAEASYRRSLRRRCECEEEIRQARAAAERRALEDRVGAETARRKQLLAMARDLRSADEIRSLVSRVSGAKAGEPGVELWSAWAMGVADRLDPVLRLILDERGAATLQPPDWPDLGAETLTE